MLEINCQSKVCKQEARRFLEFMDLEVDPCDDFSKFVCGKFYDKMSCEVDCQNVPENVFKPDASECLSRKVSRIIGNKLYMFKPYSA